MVDLTDLTYVIKADSLRVGGSNKPIFVHKRHRWVLPIIHFTQTYGILNEPCTIVNIDGHRDWAFYGGVTNVEMFDDIRQYGVTHERLKAYLADDRDDDAQWLVSAVDFNLVDSVILIGGQLEAEMRTVPWDERKVIGDIEDSVPFVAQDVRGVFHEVHPLHTYTVAETEGGYEHSVLLKSMAGVEQLRWWKCYEIVSEIAADQLFLTVDLDFFAADPFGETRLWDLRDLEVFLALNISPPSFGKVVTTGDLIRLIAKKSVAISVATEVDHCGGIENAKIAYQWAREYFGMDVSGALFI